MQASQAKALDWGCVRNCWQLLRLDMGMCAILGLRLLTVYYL